MKNNNAMNPPEIKKNLFKLTKRGKKVINKMISNNNNQIKSINNPKLRNKKNSYEKSNYNKLNSFLSQTTPLFNIIIKNNNENIENMENDYLTNINNGKNEKLLSERNIKNNLNIIKEGKNLNPNQTMNLSKNVSEIIKRRINEKKIEKIKNKIKKINKNKKTKLSNSRIITLKDNKRTNINSNNAKKISKKINDLNTFNTKDRNNKEKNDLNYLEDEKINEKYYETKRLSINVGKEDNEDFENLDDRTINEEKNISKLNLSLDEKSKESKNNSSKKYFTKVKSLKNINYDYDSFFEEENKSTKKISIINSTNNSNKKSHNEKHFRYVRNNNFSFEHINPLIISISNFDDIKKDINEEKNKNINSEQIKVNLENKHLKIKKEENKNPIITPKNKENILIIKTNTNSNSDNLKKSKDKSEIEKIQKIISNTIESLNISLNNQKLKNKNSFPNSFNNSVKESQNIFEHKKTSNKFPLGFNNTNNNINISGRKTYFKKIISSQKKKNIFGNSKDKNHGITMEINNKDKSDKLNMSYEGIKFIKKKNLLLNDNLDNNNIQNQSSNNYFALNNCCYNLNNNTNNIFYEITSPSSDFLLNLNNNINNNNLNKYRILKLNNTYVNENLMNINNESISNENININFSKNYEDIINLINFEDFIILDTKLIDIKTSLLLKRQIINESFEYLNYYYTSSIYQNIEMISKKIIDWNYIKICLVCKLLSIIICYDCSKDKKIFEQTYLLLKEIVDLNYRNTIILYEYLLNVVMSGNNLYNKNNLYPYIQKIKKLINEYHKSEEQNELNELSLFDEKNKDIPFFQKIKNNMNYITNNLNIIISNIKSKNINNIKTLFKSMNNISFQSIFHNFFTYILFIKNIKGSILGQTIIINNLFKRNDNIIPYIKTKNLKKYSLVLDLEETLLHYNKDNQYNNNEGYVDIRPGTLIFLDNISQYYELIVFNEGEKKFTDILIDTLEENKIYFEHRFYREHIIIDNNDIVKDLVMIGRDLDKILIIDNMKQNFKYQKENGILIKSFYGLGDGRYGSCNVLEELGNILIKIAKNGGDIRKGLFKYKNEIINKVTLGYNNII